MEKKDHKAQVPRNENFIHHTNSKISDSMREIVFGLEDGMVSTFGSITGIASATRDPFTTVLAGIVIIAVESISMAVGSYLSSKSEQAINERKLEEEKYEIKKYPQEEKLELIEMYIKEGWPENLSKQMAQHASTDKKLFLQEMAYRELQIIPQKNENPLKNGIVMGFSYIAGGLIPLFPYFFLPLPQSIIVSIIVSLCGLFILGGITTKFSKRKWYTAGAEMLVLGGVAGAIGYFVGGIVDTFYKR